MNVLVTAADSALGAMLCQHLAKGHDVAPVGRRAAANIDGYQCVDLVEAERVANILQGVDAVVHALPNAARLADVDSEGELLDWVSRATYVLATTACAAGVRRIVLLSSLDLMRSYDERFIVTAQWQPRPLANAESLAPHMAELVGREVARTGKIEVVALRLGNMDVEVTAGEVAEVVESALSEPLSASYHWQVQHVASSGRFAD